MHVQTQEGSGPLRSEKKKKKDVAEEHAHTLESFPVPFMCLSMVSPRCKANPPANTASLFFTPLGDEAKSKVVELKK